MESRQADDGATITEVVEVAGVVGVVVEDSLVAGTDDAGNDDGDEGGGSVADGPAVADDVGATSTLDLTSVDRAAQADRSAAAVAMTADTRRVMG